MNGTCIKPRQGTAATRDRTAQMVRACTQGAFLALKDDLPSLVVDRDAGNYASFHSPTMENLYTVFRELTAGRKEMDQHIHEHDFGECS